MNIYTKAPLACLMIEATMSAAAVWWFVRHRASVQQPVSLRTQWGLYGLLAGGALLSLPVAHVPARQWLGL